MAPSREWRALLRAKEKHHPRVRVRTHNLGIWIPGLFIGQACRAQGELESWLEPSGVGLHLAKSDLTVPE